MTDFPQGKQPCLGMVVIHQKCITFLFLAKCFDKYGSQVVSLPPLHQSSVLASEKSLWENFVFLIYLIAVWKWKVCISAAPIKADGRFWPPWFSGRKASWELWWAPVIVREQQGMRAAAKRQTWRERRSGRCGTQALGFSKSPGNIFSWRSLYLGNSVSAQIAKEEESSC